MKFFLVVFNYFKLKIINNKVSNYYKVFRNYVVLVILDCQSDYV
jgi:hypothetical protein